MEKTQIEITKEFRNRLRKICEKNGNCTYEWVIEKALDGKRLPE